MDPRYQPKNSNSTLILKRNLRHALKKGQLEDAESLLREIQSVEPLTKESRGYELEILVKRKKTQEAILLSTQLVNLYPDSSRILLLAGQAEYQNKNYVAAISFFRESLRLHPHPLTRYWLGKTLLQKSQFREAEKELRSVLEMYPRGWTDLAWLYEREDNLEEAIKCFEKYLELFPEDKYAKQSKTRLKAKSLSPDELLKEMQDLENWGEDLPIHLIPLFVTRLLETGQGAKARKLIQSLKLARSDSFKVAWTCYKAKAYDMAFDLFYPHMNQSPLDYKVLQAFENSAKQCQRVEQILLDYEKWAPTQKVFYGRMKKLKIRPSP